MFSIIVPLYNKEKYIQATVESVLNQTYSNFEIIIVDDGSTDGGFTLVSKIKDKRIKLFRKENGGVSDTRNYGIAKATGKYIIFLDADDLWEKDFLEHIIQLQIKYPKAEMFACSYKVKDKIIRIDSNEEYIWIPDYFKYAQQNICWTSTLCFTKTLVEKTGKFRVGIKRGEDLDYWLRAAIRTEGIAYCNKPLAIYNTGTENSAACSFKSYKESFPYWEWYEISVPSRFFKKYVSYMIYTLAKSAFRFKKYEDTIYILSKCRGSYKIIKRIYLYIISWIKK